MLCETLSAFEFVVLYTRGAPEYRRPRAMFCNAFGVTQRSDPAPVWICVRLR
jgi:hypothetical protein